MQSMSRNRSSESSEKKQKSEEIVYTNSGITKTIEEYIHSDRDRKILRRRLVDGILIFDLSEEFDLSPRQIQRIVTKGEHIIFSHYLEE